MIKNVDKRLLGYNVLLAAAAAAILLWISVKANEYALKVQEDLRQATAVAKADRELADLMETILEAETGQRGYLLTRKDSFLADLAAAREKALATVTDYRSLRSELGEAAPPSMRRCATRSRRNSRSWPGRSISPAPARSRPLDIVRGGTGAEAKLRIRAAVNEAQEKLGEVRLHYRDELSVTAAELRRTNLEGAFGILALSILSIGAMAWHNRQLLHARSDLREANQQLEARVAGPSAPASSCVRMRKSSATPISSATTCARR